jgi:hypothetical protein
MTFGTPSHRLAVFSIILVGFGALFFGIPGTVIEKEEKNQKHMPQNKMPVKLSGWDSFAVSLNHFLPVNIPWGDTWMPADKPVKIKLPFSNRLVAIRPDVFATFALKLAGWILVPLGVAALTGLLKVNQ